MGHIYAFDCGSFVKIGKTLNPDKRKRSLLNEYKIKEFCSEWISEPIDNFNEAEGIAQNLLRDSCISGEKFSASFEQCINACMSAVNSSSSLVDAGEIGGLKILVDPASGYINVTEYIKSADFGLSAYQFLRNESVKYMNEEILKRTGCPSSFTTRGRKSATFMHPFLFIEVNRAMGAKNKVLIYKWMLEEMGLCEPIKRAINKTKEEGESNEMV